jgi:hypothetical protein
MNQFPLLYCIVTSYLQPHRPFKQCCGAVKFWYRSGAADSYLRLTRLTDQAPDPAIFVIEKKLFFSSQFFRFLLFKGTFTSFLKD